ncbi:hypothetical protein OD917_09415 [Flavobacterium sp. SH_e]|uniref:hypothetical protein n=1 Tax=Flavobacterium TaxID=237 RepID=UPI0021E3C068|nr:hypothetical protein [Flavobacterium sp. SH_e]MCV2485140.1 hypothetical protein [Flavobacterium sp. SH_e]
MKTALLFVLFFIATICQAQTKLISHKSHSGSISTFAKAYHNNLFDIGHSNFGLYESHINKVDTIIAINNSITLVKYRQSKKEYKQGVKFEDLEKSAFIHKTDTLKNHPIYNKKNTVKSIKAFNTEFAKGHDLTPLNEIVFIGFKKK